MELPTPYSKAAVDDIIKAKNWQDVTVIVENGSTKGNNFIAEILRIKVNGMNKQGKKEMMSLIMKIAPRKLELRKTVCINMFFKREIFAYIEMLPVLFEIQKKYQLPQEDKFHYPKLLKSLTPVTGTGEMMIFEDLGAQGFEAYDRVVPFDYDHLSIAIKNIARFHATSIVLKEKNPKLYNEIAAQTSHTYDYGEGFDYFSSKCYEKILTIIEDPSDRARLKDYLQNKIDSDKQRLVNPKTAAPYNVLCHGDCWSNNFLYAYKDGRVCDLRMLDWQIIRCASPVTDISYAMFMSMDEKMLTKHYHEMLELYYETLSHNLSKMGLNASALFPKYVFEEQVKTTMRYGLILAIPVLPITLAEKTEVPELDTIFDEKASAGKDVIFSCASTTRLKSLIKFCITEKII